VKVVHGLGIQLKPVPVKGRPKKYERGKNYMIDDKIEDMCLCKTFYSTEMPKESERFCKKRCSTLRSCQDCKITVATCKKYINKKYVLTEDATKVFMRFFGY